MRLSVGWVRSVILQLRFQIRLDLLPCLTKLELFEHRHFARRSAEV